MLGVSLPMTAAKGYSFSVASPHAPSAPMYLLETRAGVTPMGRRGTVEEIAATALFLAGADAGYITGHTLVVDGGWTAR